MAEPAPLLAAQLPPDPATDAVAALRTELRAIFPGAPHDAITAAVLACGECAAVMVEAYARTPASQRGRHVG